MKQSRYLIMAPLSLALNLGCVKSQEPESKPTRLPDLGLLGAIDPETSRVRLKSEGAKQVQATTASTSADKRASERHSVVAIMGTLCPTVGLRASQIADGAVHSSDACLSLKDNGFIDSVMVCSRFQEDDNGRIKSMVIDQVAISGTTINQGRYAPLHGFPPTAEQAATGQTLCEVVSIAEDENLSLTVHTDTYQSKGSLVQADAIDLAPIVGLEITVKPPRGKPGASVRTLRAGIHGKFQVTKSASLWEPYKGAESIWHPKHGLTHLRFINQSSGIFISSRSFKKTGVSCTGDNDSMRFHKHLIKSLSSYANSLNSASACSHLSGSECTKLIEHNMASQLKVGSYIEKVHDLVNNFNKAGGDEPPIGTGCLAEVMAIQDRLSCEGSGGQKVALRLENHAALRGLGGQASGSFTPKWPKLFHVDEGLHTAFTQTQAKPTKPVELLQADYIQFFEGGGAMNAKGICGYTH